MDNIKVGDIVELYNDATTAIQGRVTETRSFLKKDYFEEQPDQLVYAIRIEGIGTDLYDYEWELGSLNGQVI